MTTPDTEFIDQINRLLDQHLDDPTVSVDALCRDLGKSRSQLHRIIKEQSGLSVSRYIRQRRLSKARQLLQETPLRISEISDAIGMGSIQNFSKYFAEEFGLTPTDYRKQHKRPTPDAVLTGETATPVSPVEPVATPPAPEQVTPPAHPRRRPFWRGVYAVLGLGVAVGIGIWWLMSRGPATPAINSLAVLPFVNLGSAETEPACAGITDDIHRSVSLLNNLQVIARSSSDQYGKTDKTTWQIGNDLHVAHLLKGAVQRINNQIRVRVELIDTQADVRLWVRTYTRPDNDIFVLTDQIVADMARQLKRTTARKPISYTRNLTAYNLFLQGRQLVVGRSKDQLQRSIRYFDAAVTLDTNFAEAIAFKAEAYMLMPVMGYSDRQQANRLAEQNALAAIRLDPANSTAYGVLGTLYHDLHQWEAAQNTFRIAIEHNPNDAQAHYWYSLVLRSVGKLPEAVEQSTKAVALDPIYPVILAGHVVNCAYAGRFDLADASLESGRDLFQNSFVYQTAQSYVCLAAGRYRQAIDAFARAQELNAAYRTHNSAALYCEAKAGHRPKALTFLRTQVLRTPRDYYDRAVVFAGLNQTDSCMAALKKAADGDYFHRDTKVSPIFRPYRNHPVFGAVLRQFHVAD